MSSRRTGDLDRRSERPPSPASNAWPGRALIARASRWSPRAASVLVRVDRRTDTGRHTRWHDLMPVLRSWRGGGAVSVDVFDTVLVRAVVGEGTIYWLTAGELQRSGAWSGPVEDFVAARLRAAAELPWAGLTALYHHEALAARCDPALGVAAEEGVEVALIRAVPGAREAMAALRSTGTSVTFLTDMHLSRTSLAHMLAAEGISCPGDRLVISSEVGAAKSTGDLYTSAMGGRADHHFGNDLWADIARAERAGIPATPIRSAEPTAFELAMAGRTGSLGSAIAGAARLGRLSCPPASDTIERRLFDLGADVPGQCLTAFLLWVRDECGRDGIEDIAFRAGGGQPHLELARAMPSDHWDDLRLTALDCDRNEWALAGASVVGIERFLEDGFATPSSFLNQHLHDAPFSSVLCRVGLAPPDVPTTSRLRRIDASRPLPEAQVDDWFALLQRPDVRARVAERAEQRRSAFRRRLRRHSALERRLALVDTGWGGRLAPLLSALVEDAGGPPPLHLDFGGVDATDGTCTEVRRFAVDGATGTPPELGEPLGLGPSPERAALWDGAMATARHLPSRQQLAALGLSSDHLAEEVRAVLTAFRLHPTPAVAEAVSALQG